MQRAITFAWVQNSVTTVFEPVANLGAASGLMFATMSWSPLAQRPEYPGAIVAAAANQNPYRDGQYSWRMRARSQYGHELSGLRCRWRTT